MFETKLKYYQINLALIIIFVAIIIFLLLNVDNIVHSSLYSYGLQFSYEWANPYWLYLRLALCLLFLLCIISGILFYLSFREAESFKYIRCPICHKKIPIDSNICPNCNYIIKEGNLTNGKNNK